MVVNGRDRADGIDASPVRGKGLFGDVQKLFLIPITEIWGSEESR